MQKTESDPSEDSLSFEVIVLVLELLQLRMVFII